MNEASQENYPNFRHPITPALIRYQLGQALAGQQRWEEAIAHYRKALELEPNLNQAQQALEQALAQKETPSEKTVNVPSATENDTNSPAQRTQRSYRQQVQQYAQKGQWEQAAQQLQELIKLEPSLEAYRDLGEIQAKQQKWEQAIEAYQNAIALQPDHQWVCQRLATLLEAQQQWEQLEQVCRHAIQFHPKQATFHHLLGDALSKSGSNQEEAVTAYQQAIALDPEFSWSHNNLGDALMKLARWQEAAEAYRSAIALKDDFPWSHYNLAKATSNLGNQEEAIVAYREAKHLQPDLPDIDQHLAHALFQRGKQEDLEQALQLYQELLAENHDDAELNEQQANILFELQRWEEATQAYRSAIALNDNLPWSYYNLGKATSKLGNLEEAIIAYRRAKQLQPDLPDINQHLADAISQQQQQNQTQAWELYQQAINDNPDYLPNYYKAREIKPHDPTLNAQLADALAKQGREEEAIVFQEIASRSTQNKSPVNSSFYKQTLCQYYQATLDNFLLSQKKLNFYFSNSPQISVILVLYNRAELTFQCLQSLAADTTLVSEYPIELIIVDNASSDQTSELLNCLEGIKLIQNEENLNFVAAVNQAYQIATGEYLLLLNNDAQVLPGSIASAVNTIQNGANIGAVGGKVVLLDGTLQEAGSIVWNDGSCLGYGRGESPKAPAYMFQRDVDYCSGVFLLTKRTLFEQMGGFDSDYKPAYYEETDYCLRLWERGERVVYDPDAVVFHFEFASSTSSEAAFALQKAHQDLFVQKHSDQLASHLNPSPSNILAARSAQRDLPRILFIEDRVPHAFLGSGYPRAQNILKSLVDLGYFVTFYPLTFPKEAWQSVYQDIPKQVEVIIDSGVAGLESFLQERAHYFQAILVSRPHNAEYLEPILTNYPDWFTDTKIIYDAEAIYALREAEQVRVTGKEISQQEIQTQLQQELNLAKKADAVIAVSELEKQHFIEQGISSPTYTLGHTLQAMPTETSFEKREGILFVGAIHDEYSPNADSMFWFVEQILPRIRSRLASHLKFTIAGFSDCQKIFDLQDNATQVLGKVEELKPLYEHAKIFVAPTRFAAGIPRKVHEAAAQGIPVVTTSLIAKQLGWQSGSELLVADAPENFAGECTRLYQDPVLWNQLRENALQRVKNDCSPENFRNQIKDIMQNTIAVNNIT